MLGGRESYHGEKVLHPCIFVHSCMHTCVTVGEPSNFPFFTCNETGGEDCSSEFGDKNKGRGCQFRRMAGLINFFIIIIFYLFILRERESMSGRGGRERGRGRKSQAGSALSAWSPLWGSNSQNREITRETVRSRPEPKPRVGRLTEPPRLPSTASFKLFPFPGVHRRGKGLCHGERWTEEHRGVGGHITLFFPSPLSLLFLH